MHCIKASGLEMQCRLPPSYSFKPVWKAEAIGLYLDSLDKIDDVVQRQAKGDSDLPAELIRPIRTKRASEAPRVLANTTSKPRTSRKRARTGPCVLLCQQTSGTTSFRKARWNAVPSPSPWPRVSPGDTLCQKCFLHMKKHKAKGTLTPYPAHYAGLMLKEAFAKSQQDKTFHPDDALAASTRQAAASSSCTSWASATARPPGA